MAATVAGIHLGPDTHANRPAASAAPVGSFYYCTDHDLLYITDGSTWTTYLDNTGGGGGSVATDAIWDAAGDLAVGTGADTAARLAKGAEGTFLRSGATTLAHALPPGHEYTYNEITSSVSVTATAEASADTCITATGVAFDGSTPAVIEVFSPASRPRTDAAGSITVWLFDDTGGGAASVGRLALWGAGPTTGNWFIPIYAKYRLTPSSATHTYSIRATVSGGTGSFGAGAGGAGVSMPAFIRIAKAT